MLFISIGVRKTITYEDPGTQSPHLVRKHSILFQGQNCQIKCGKNSSNKSVVQRKLYKDATKQKRKKSKDNVAVFEPATS